ncbi:hypothetical protein E2C01_101277 [Portunus trituberculatus]|uniref:Uncharacterized protein n=1 Tax=Portunus trituberculatus TaxID=210409 RepID=A0A5B7KK21_PORTR|nr:hypothetical protein [Portunus trituberculatus]
MEARPGTSRHASGGDNPPGESTPLFSDESDESDNDFHITDESEDSEFDLVTEGLIQKLHHRHMLASQDFVGVERLVGVAGHEDVAEVYQGLEVQHKVSQVLLST